jgi:excisionase family DNA binding protein
MKDKKITEPTQELLSPKQAASLLEISPSGILHAIQRGKIDVVRFGEIALIPRSALERYAATRKRGRPLGWRKKK